MRSFDTWNRYVDNQGNPLHGCIQFMVKDGNTVAPIFNSDGTPLSNPILTDIYGRTQYQVFVDVDVIAYFYKYIGDGVWTTQLDIDTSDQSKWSLQYTIENQNTMSRVIDSTGLTCVATINDLRNLDVESVPLVNGMKIVTLLGYYNQGDKEPINYVWNETNTDADNGGSVIKYEDEITGRWIMVQPTEHCDTRHFGAFPQNSYNTADQSYQIGLCCVYCMLHGIRPFFNGSTDYRWFKYSNLNVVVDAFDVTEDTRFYDVGNNTFQGEWNGNPHFALGNTEVVSKKVKTSWNAKSYTGYEYVVIDSNHRQKNWQDAVIDVQVNPLYGYNFTHCTFIENGNIGSDNVNGINNTFNNCKLNERMFILDGDYTVSLVNLCTNCQYDMDDFRNSMWLYKQIRCTSDSNPFFDYRDMPNVGKPYDNFLGNKLLGDSIEVSNLKNALATKVNIVKLANQTAIIFEDCTGWYQIPSNMTVVIKDSDVKLTLGSNVALSIRNSTVEYESGPTTFANALNVTATNSTLAGAMFVCNNFNVRDCILNAQVDTTYGYFYNTTISQDVSCGYVDIQGCNIGSALLLYGVEGDLLQIPNTQRDGTIAGYYTNTRYINGNIKDNFVSGQIVLGITDSSNAHYTLNWLARGLTITDNTGLSANPITINRGYSTLFDDYNQYVYKNNTGTMAMTSSITATVYQGTNNWPPTQYSGFITGYGNNSVYAYTYRDVDDPNKYADAYAFQTKLFSIGTINVRATLITTVTPNATTITPWKRFNCATIGGNTISVDSIRADQQQTDIMIKLNSGVFDWGVKVGCVAAGYVGEVVGTYVTTYDITLTQA